MPTTLDEEMRSFLRNSMVVQAGTLSLHRRPFATPLWFVLDRGVLYLTTAPGSRAGKNIRNNPQVTLLFRGEHARTSGRLLRLRCDATCHSGLPPRRVLLRIAAKYYLSPRALRVELANTGRWNLRRRYYGQATGGPGHLRTVPTSAEFLPDLR